MPKIALTLSTGGARGIAHIGVIEEFERQGFEISSISGCSMGALVGAAYATGNLQACKEWLYRLNRWKLFSLVDLSLSSQGLCRGERVLTALKQVIPHDTGIENLPIPYTAVATDLASAQDIVFDSGSLYDAIRASISLPILFKPFKKDGMILTDGGMTNPLPLNRIARTPGDLLVAVLVSAPSGSQENPRLRFGLAELLKESSTMMIQTLARRSIEQHQPDIVIRVPCLQYGLSQFYKSRELIEEGACAAREALLQYRQTTATEK